MKIEYWTESEINEDGTVGDPVQPERGSIGTKPRMETSGMHHLQTRSTVEAGLWMLVTTGRLDDGTCHGITLFFDDEVEMRAFSRTRKASAFIG